MVLRLASSIVPLSVGRVCSKFQVQRCKDQRYNDTYADIHFDSMGDLELRAEPYTQRRITARLQTSQKCRIILVAYRILTRVKSANEEITALVLRSRGRHQVERGSHNATDEGRHSGNPSTVHTLGSVHFHKDNLRHLS